MASYGTRRTNATLSLGFGYLNTGITETYYRPGTYPAVMQQGEYTFPIPETVNYDSEVGNSNSPIIGISGIIAVSKKASIIWDAMIITGNKRTTFDEQFTEFNYDPITYKPSYVTYTDPFIKVKATNILFMPGMRFQKDQSKAFQVTLAGIIGKREVETNKENYTNSYSFPVPMLSWFYKF